MLPLSKLVKRYIISFPLILSFSACLPGGGAGSSLVSGLLQGSFSQNGQTGIDGNPDTGFSGQNQASADTDGAADESGDVFFEESGSGIDSHIDRPAGGGEGTINPDSSPTPSGGDDALPQASVPVPIMAYNTDSNGDVPMTTSSSIAVSSSEFALHLNQSQDKTYRWAWEKPFQKNSTEYNIRNLSEHALIKLASLISKDAVAEAEDSYCDQENVTCCIVDANDQSTHTCYYPLTDMSVSTLYVKRLDAQGQPVGAAQSENIHGNILWLAETPVGLATLSDSVLPLRSNSVAKIKKSGDKFQVQSYSSDSGDYSEAGVSGTKLAYDHNTSTVALLSENTGINLHSNSTGAVEGRYATFRLNSSTLNFTVQKYTTLQEQNNISDRGLYFGVEVSQGSEATALTNGYPNLAYIYRVTNSEENSDENQAMDVSTAFTSDHSPGVKFIKTGDKDARGKPLTHKRTIAFDANNSDYFIVLYEDGFGKVRLRAANESERFGGEVPLQDQSKGKHNFKQVVFANDNIALLIDQTQNMVWKIDVDDSAKTITYNLDAATNGIAVGQSPIAGQLTDDKNYFLVLNQDDESISVIDLNTFSVARTISLADQIADRVISHRPVSLNYFDGNIFVGNQKTKSVLVIPFSSQKSKSQTSSSSSDPDVLNRTNHKVLEKTNTDETTEEDDDSLFQPTNRTTPKNQTDSILKNSSTRVKGSSSNHSSESDDEEESTNEKNTDSSGGKSWR